MILILTQDSDVHADSVAEKLRERDADVVRFDPALFPSRAAISVCYSAAGVAYATLQANGTCVDLSNLTTVWYRRPGVPLLEEGVADPATRQYLSEECKAVLNDVWHTLACRFVPGLPSVLRSAELKAAQLVVAGNLGFELPPTLITTRPEDFLEFYRQHNGNVISKLPSSTLYRLTGTRFNRYTQVLSTREVAYAQTLRRCPVIFQAYVPKRMELRITVVGSALFAAEIHSQFSQHTRFDWRRYDHFETPYRIHCLPDEVAQRCLSLVRQLGLCYGAIDLVLTPDGRYVFLEINPNGQYLWIEHATGLPISDAVCDLLLAGAATTEPAQVAGILT